VAFGHLASRSVRLRAGVTGVSPALGSTVGGTSVRITGVGFTAATAVDFGTLPALSYTVSPDLLIVATTPAESAGVVDVTVTTSGGISAISSADKFTFLAPPTVKPRPPRRRARLRARRWFVGVGGRRATWGSEPDIHLAGDESARRVVPPAFSANGTNAAKNSTATFHQAGAYVFTVTITDPIGQTVTSSVAVTVNQTLTTIVVNPSTANVNVGRRSSSRPRAKTSLARR